MQRAGNFRMVRIFRIYLPLHAQARPVPRLGPIEVPLLLQYNSQMMQRSGNMRIIQFGGEGSNAA